MSTSSSTEGVAGGRAALAKLPLLAYVAPEARQLVEDSFEPVSFPFGALIVREGEPADAYFVLVSGTARAVKAGEHGEEVPLNTLGPGDGFGEVALLEETARTATVRASTEVHALRLDRSVFAALARSRPEIREQLELQVHRHHVRDFLRVRSPLGQLPPAALSTVLAELRPRTARGNEVVLSQGGPPESLFIVRDGHLHAYQDRDGERVDVAFLRPGDMFGEVALLDGAAQPATVEAMGEASLLELPEAAFRTLLAGEPAFGDVFAERSRGRVFRGVARVPLDFAEELLPADAAAEEPLGPGQVDEVYDDAAIGDEPEVADQWEGFTRPARRIRRFPHIWQIDEADCGAACVAAVCRYFGRRVSLARVREAVHTGSSGTSLLGIARGGAELGLATRTIKASPSRLDELPLPAIVHWEGNHWVVLYDTDPKHVRVADPARGLRRLHRDEFLEKWSGYAALLARTDALDDQPESGSSIRWFAQFFRPHRRTLVRALVLALIAAGLEMTIPVFGKVIVDQVVIAGDHSLLTVMVVAMFGAIVLTVLATTVQRYMLARTTVQIDRSALDFLTGRLLALPMGYFNARRTGDIERRLNGMRQVRQFIVHNGVLGLTAAAQVFVAVVLMFIYSPLLAAVYLAAAPLYAVLMRFSAKRIRPMFDSLEESFGKYQSRQIDAIKGIETVKAMGVERSLRQLMLTQFNDLADRLFRADYTVMLYEGAIQLVTFLSLALFLWIGALLAIHGDLTIGGLVAFNALVVLANAPTIAMLAVWDQLQYSSILLGRLNDILEHEPEQGDDHSALRPVPTLEGAIAFHGMGFHYAGPVPVPILQDITLEVAPGTSVAIVGRSGSGKTTLIKCLAGLFEPTSGSITYDGVDLRSLDYRQLRRQIGFVLQENHLFDGTIAQNIAFADDHVDIDRVTWAARLANAHEFIQRLPLGYETKIGESGLLLSGGQRQRIAIARAVYPRPSVLIFDEATSSLDTESERAVQDNMDRLLEGRTSFVIAHRLSTVRNADLIVVLEQGRIVEQGTHEQLLANEGLYYYLTSQQLEM
jgi:ATP-binding cassette subfamily B protein